MAFILSAVNGVSFIQCDELIAAGAVHGFSTRLGGVSRGIFSRMNLSFTRGDEPSAVTENHRRFARAVGYPMERLISSRQVHGDVVRIASEADCGKGLRQEIDYECDAVITNIPNLPMMILTADCCPVLLYDPICRAAGAVHAGWRGTALGIAGKAAGEMQRVFGCKPENIIAAVGPCISKCCFETDRDVPQAMTDKFGDGARPYIAQAGDKFHVDMKGLNRLSLEMAGVRRIFTTDECTACDTSRYFSHRLMGDNRGSLASVIMIPEA